ncbi:GNAT family N-acetyltransferase [Microbacterium betulae]|uniref:GNAT family N-acetyltransferase n=1 Tax=Microbacterium betulae TaxID=2981139 RepID=A0AA97FHH9_9MICO|nr:GNAT family N-acetyltransferase [Microbacterium sp. AB]WOF22179.1 GNAT family N-acetyltransferase [Microbacterium sp. AB]
MSTIDPRAVPADTTSQDRLAKAGLDYRVVDGSDRAALARTLQAVSRGFLGPEVDEQSIAEQHEQLSDRRYVGVFDTSVAQADVPVATVDSWVTPLTVPGGEIDMWAISGVTVSATHRRRGIARAMLEGEVRAAADAGLAIAGLTVTETTIYGRYGFGPAIPVSSWTIDTRRAGWAGYEPRGRLEFVSREQLAHDLGKVHERGRARRAGEIAGWPRRWRQHAGLSTSVKDGDAVRGVRYRDADGVVRGAMAYRVTEDERDFALSRLAVRHLAAETPDAAAALWRFALQHDLVAEVTAELRPVDDPVRWLVRDERGAAQTVRDHGWLRILDVPRTLEARTYSAPVTTTFSVTDPLGLTTGSWRLEVGADGRGRVSRAPGADADLRLDVAQLSSLYLGGTPATGLLAAGRVAGDPAVAADLDVALRPPQPPTLGIWY